MFRYLLPVLIPSWRFFDFIAPSPRIEFAVIAQLDDPATRWQEFRPRPVHLPVAAMLRRLLWNPIWNESLFIVSCAEKLLDEPSIRRMIEFTVERFGGLDVLHNNAAATLLMLTALAARSAATLDPANKELVIRLLASNLRLTNPADAEDSYQTVINSYERVPHTSLEGMKRLHKLLIQINPKVTDVRVENVIDPSFMNKLESSGFIQSVYKKH
jgi:hypothetical protein